MNYRFKTTKGTIHDETGDSRIVISILVDKGSSCSHTSAPESECDKSVWEMLENNFQILTLLHTLYIRIHGNRAKRTCLQIFHSHWNRRRREPFHFDKLVVGVLSRQVDFRRYRVSTPHNVWLQMWVCTAMSIRSSLISLESWNLRETLWLIWTPAPVAQDLRQGSHLPEEGE